MSFLDDVLNLWRAKPDFSPAEIARAAEWAKAQAFNAAGVYRKRTLETLHDLVTKAIREGWDVRKFQDSAADAVARFKSGSYADMFYRTNTASAEAAGNYATMFDGYDKVVAPYWKFHAVHDSRNDSDEKCPNTMCRWLDGRVFAKADQAAMPFLSPVHWMCRCYVTDLTEREVRNKSLRITAGSEIPFRPPEGWDFNRLALVPPIFNRELRKAS